MGSGPLGCLSSALAFAMLHRPGATKAIPERQVLQARTYQHDHSFRIGRNGSYTCGVSTDMSCCIVALERVCQAWCPPYYLLLDISGSKSLGPPQREREG